MNRYRYVPWAAVVAIALVPLFATGGPQDNWYFQKKIGSTGTGDGQFNFGNSWSMGFIGAGLAVGTNGYLFVADTANHRIQVLDSNGTFLYKWGTSGSANGQFSYPSAIAIGTNELVYVADRGNNRIQVFGQDGAFQRSWSSGCPSGVALNRENGLVHVADNSAKMINVYQDNGTTGVVVRSFGGAGSTPGKFGNIRALTVGHGGTILVGDDRAAQRFDASGTYISEIAWVISEDCYGLHAGMDGLFYIGNGPADGYGLQQGILRMVDASLVPVAAFYYASDETVSAIAESRDGCSLYLTTQWEEIFMYKRAYRTMSPPARNLMPLPAVTSMQQRPGTTWVDIDYRVIDADSPTVSVGALAFLNGGADLGSVIKMNTFEENSQTNIGVSVSANVDHRLVWNVGADMVTNYVNLQASILAKDNRGLLDLDYITIPSNGPNPQLTINSIPFDDADMLPVWMWLIATNDAAINLVSGAVYGVQGVYTNKVLASGSSTTSNGVDFICERLNVRRATTAEVTRAKQASSPGITNQWTPRNSIVGSRTRPSKINEYGFDTGDSGYWVVPLP